MATFEEACRTAIKDGVANCIAFFARRRDGSVICSEYMGSESMSSPEKAINKESVFTIASVTKLATTVAVLQLVEKQVIGLDDDVGNILPELAQQSILGFEDDKPVLKPREHPITLRHLLTHSLGTTYDQDKRIKKYIQHSGKTRPTTFTVEQRCALPLVYEPGTGWEYSTGLDWAGKLVERLTLATLEQYMAENIWKPLGASSFTFWPKTSTAVLAKRTADGGLKDTPNAFALNAGSLECFGGHGGFSNAEDMMELVFSLLANDERLLRKQTVDMMFQGQLSPQSKVALKVKMQTPSWVVGDFYPDKEEYDWGLGGLLINSLGGSGRRHGVLVWSGAPNIFWFIDRMAGLCGLFVTQVFPPGDLAIEGLIKAFQDSVYEKENNNNLL